MDLRIFHSVENSHRNYKTYDRFNSWTGRQSCRLLEWAGWYSSSIPLRLLGHYRLYQIHKGSLRRRQTDLPPVQGYILQYRNFHGVKFWMARIFSHFPAMWGFPEIQVEILAVNRLLLHEQVFILSEFLMNAENDFEAAFKLALQQIQSPAFLNAGSMVKPQHANVFVQLKQYYQTTNNIANHQLSFQSVIQNAPSISGKEKGVFSKKQVLILFDMLSQGAKGPLIDLGNPKIFDDIAEFLKAVTGKGKSTWVEELKNYHNKDLYGWHTSEELSQLIIVLSNLAQITGDAGLHAVYRQIDKKISELEAKRSELKRRKK